MSAMGSLWASLLEDGLVREAVVTQAAGAGTVSALAAWPPGSRSELTDHFRTCVRELWSCLDALVVESVESFSVQRRIHNPERARFFPIADSVEAFQALLAESCMDGTLRNHVAMVRDCQPFQDSDDDEMVGRLRRGLRILLAWDDALESGAEVGAWATPIDPQVYAEAPALVECVDAEAPGPINDDERIVARYRLRSYTGNCSVFANADTDVDLCFAHGFVPENAEDTFEQRLRLVIEVVTRFAISFAWLTSQAPGSRKVLASDADTESEPETWIDAARSTRGWSDHELTALADSDLGIGLVQDTETLTLLVNTADGVFERTVPHATPLRAHDRLGTAAEIAVRDAAATWGLPDFVMAPSVERKGRGSREISDGLLVVGDRGVVVQIKAREGEPGTPERETNWILKQIAGACKQIDGSVRRLTNEDIDMVNGRGRSIRVDGPAINWVGVVIIEHPAPPQDVAIPAHDAKIPVIALLRRDWEFLFDQLRSTYAVVQYLHRVGVSAPLLGGEPERYYELAAADAAVAPAAFDESWIRRGAVPRSVPLLPTAPAGSDDDEAHTMVRIILEDIATSPSGPVEPEARQRVLASLDRLPVGHRSYLGRFLLKALSTITGNDVEAGTTVWHTRTLIGDKDADQYAFAVCSEHSELTRAAFTAWLRLRRHERADGEGMDSLTAVGVLLTPRSDGRREWDTTVVLIDGDPKLTDQEFQAYRRLWNKPAEPDS
jgi:hypothetical protein